MSLVPRIPLILWRQRQLVWRLASVQLQERYASTLLGSAWAVMQPVSVMLVFWFVFSYGLRLNPGQGQVPFVLFFIGGMVAWLAFSDAVVGAAAAITRNAFLVKKVAFPLEVLPAVPVVAAMAVHAVVLPCAAVVCWLSGAWPGWSLLLLPGYALAAALLAAGLGYLIAAMNVFYRDVGEVIGLALQLWFWLTPIVWSLDLFPPDLAQLLALNPMAFIVAGYRQAILGTPAPGLLSLLAFVVATLLAWLVGGAVFRRTRPDFADML